MIHSPLLLDSALASNSHPLQSIRIAHSKPNMLPAYTRPVIYDLRPNPITPNPRHRPASARYTSTYASPPSLPYPASPTHLHPHQHPHPHPHPPPFHTTQLFWLGLYFLFNLSLTLFNKGVLLRFPFPYTLTALHALCGSIGGYTLLDKGFYVPARRLGTRENVVLGLFSVLYAVNIVLVTVPFHQVVRASTPIFTIALSASLFGVSSSRTKMISLIPVIIGVALATYGDYYFTTWGLVLTLLGTFLAALKTLYTNILQSPPPPSTFPHSHSSLSPSPTLNLNLHPLDLLTRMAPLAFIQCVIYAHLSGELAQVRHYSIHEMSFLKAVGLVINGVLAFGLNVVSFSANGRVGAVSMTVAGNVKQVLTILFGVAIFDVRITRVNALGIGITLVGGVGYAFVDLGEKRGWGLGRGLGWGSFVRNNQIPIYALELSRDVNPEELIGSISGSVQVHIGLLMVHPR
ncbi:hypothetical protein PILCRDRAFT_83503 [Piloderma croceum F 1598]|uniref:Sugar phosphate transporter domain-containing protein n=1 Tax=Piloderma croceum (strain F 1598) TaxID=765440 RepID=A0A0C3GP02_PILCF|nr:hypothetical protein PILCRDRAFT_83503 [Piloderma croceum F 1598]